MKASSKRVDSHSTGARELPLWGPLPLPPPPSAAAVVAAASCRRCSQERSSGARQRAQAGLGARRSLSATPKAIVGMPVCSEKGQLRGGDMVDTVRLWFI